MIKSSS